MPTRRATVIASLLLILVAGSAIADQKIKTKSNIKNDRVASSCAQDCEAAGHAWAAQNQVTDPTACDSPSSEFSKGCKAELEKPAVPSAGGQ